MGPARPPNALIGAPRLSKGRTKERWWRIHGTQGGQGQVYRVAKDRPIGRSPPALDGAQATFLKGPGPALVPGP
jgi:hypothetical protein